MKRLIANRRDLQFDKPDVTPRMARDFRDALGLRRSVRMRQATVMGLSRTDNTCMVKFPDGSGTHSVPYFDTLPVPNKGCWVLTDGEDAFVISLGKASGPPTIKLGIWTAVNVSTGTDTYVLLENPMTAAGIPQNHGYDWFGYGYNIALGNTDFRMGWGGHIDGTEGRRLYFPALGVWEVWAGALWAPDTVGDREIRAETDSLVVVASDSRTATPNETRQTATGQVVVGSLAASPSLRLRVNQNSGGALNVRTVPTGLSATWMGPLGLE